MDTTCKLVVDEHLGVHVHSTECEGHMRIHHLLSGLEGLFIDEMPAFVESYGTSARHIRTSFHMDHGVMRKTDSLDGRSFILEGPPFVDVESFVSASGNQEQGRSE